MQQRAVAVEVEVDDGLRAVQLAEVEVVLHLEGPDVAVEVVEEVLAQVVVNGAEAHAVLLTGLVNAAEVGLQLVPGLRWSLTPYAPPAPPNRAEAGP